MWLEQPELVERRPLMRRVRQPYYRRGMRWALRRATRLIAISEATRARMLAIEPECAERVRVTHNAADPRFVPARTGQPQQSAPPPFSAARLRTTWWWARTSRTRATSWPSKPSRGAR